MNVVTLQLYQTRETVEEEGNSTLEVLPHFLGISFLIFYVHGWLAGE